MKGKNGYTLVELLVSIGILAVLVSTTFVMINPAKQLQKSRDSQRKSDLKVIQSALELYRSDSGAYPSGTTVNRIPSVANCPPSLTDDDICLASNTFYIQSVPKDPKTALDYYYSPGSPVGGYSIYSCLENTSDVSKLTATSNPVAPLAGSAVASALNCLAYYGVTNP